MTSRVLDKANDFIQFLNDSPTPFHAVRSAIERLVAAGFTQIHECDDWKSTIKSGGKYFLTRNGSAIVAFCIGHEWEPGNPIAIVSTHTDSPCLRIKPVSKRESDGFLQVGVHTYGGGLWHTWFDRDLGAAGRVMVRVHNGDMEQRLVRIRRPICKLPNLAVHFDRAVTFEFNKETHLLPIVGLISAELEADDTTAMQDKEKDASLSPLKPLQRHHSRLVQLAAKEADCDPEDILDFELVLYDTQPACLGGLNDEWISSARIDNLGMTYCAVEGLIQSLSSASELDNDRTTRLIACFDNEEVGSVSANGANGNLLAAVIRRLTCLTRLSREKTNHENTLYEQSLATSMLLSADMAHSIHPNYAAKHESKHCPRMNEGTVIKISANIRYATDSPGIVLLQECARRAQSASFHPKGASQRQTGVPLQMFVNRNDTVGGSTIGPMLSAKLGMRTIDVGNAQLAMHSIRETCGTHDVEHGVNLFDSFFRHYGELESKLCVD